ncbi:hypothetical protein JCM10212_002015 [Sporobolomyces blumeae]
MPEPRAVVAPFAPPPRPRHVVVRQLLEHLSATNSHIPQDVVEHAKEELRTVKESEWELMSTVERRDGTSASSSWTDYLMRTLRNAAATEKSGTNPYAPMYALRTAIHEFKTALDSYLNPYHTTRGLVQQLLPRGQQALQPLVCLQKTLLALGPATFHHLEHNCPSGTRDRQGVELSEGACLRAELNVLVREVKQASSRNEGEIIDRVENIKHRMHAFLEREWDERVRHLGLPNAEILVAWNDTLTFATFHHLVTSTYHAATDPACWKILREALLQVHSQQWRRPLVKLVQESLQAECERIRNALAQCRARHASKTEAHQQILVITNQVYGLCSDAIGEDEWFNVSLKKPLSPQIIRAACVLTSSA